MGWKRKEQVAPGHAGASWTMSVMQPLPWHSPFPLPLGHHALGPSHPKGPQTLPGNTKAPS